jgi:DNA repair photolyase
LTSDSIAEGSVIKRFDPWWGRLCTCPPKYSLSPYTGCGHSCVYCYITSYIPRAFEPRAKVNIVGRVSKDVRIIDRSLPILLSASSDPYTPIERDLGITRQVLRILADSNARFMIQTKSDLVLRDSDVISRAMAAVGVTVTATDDLAAKLEPNAPSTTRRMNALEKLSKAGVPTIARLDPIIPGVNDEILPELVEALARNGVKHVVASTYKARPDSLVRVRRAIPEAADSLERMYKREGVRISNCYYLNERARRDLLDRVRALVLSNGMTYATCREGFDDLRTSPSCDGTHLIPSN